MKENGRGRSRVRDGERERKIPSPEKRMGRGARRVRGGKYEGGRAKLRVRGGERERTIPLQLRGSAEREVRPGLDERVRGVRTRALGGGPSK